MSVEHTCFFKLAKDALELSGEDRTRNAISRSYYGIYHSALRLINYRTPGTDLEGNKLPGGSHQRLYTYFCSGDAATEGGYDANAIKKLGLKLKMQHALRVNADYRLSEKINRITAISMLSDAIAFDAEVDRLLLEATNKMTA
ncbi:hypothetical protein QQF21_17255 [Lelliottia sp. V89_10]|uniref:hypothetical protein n=1 Tax=Lelliottia wanjuensis TaxID=3050585 RepID=UPI00249E2779|nr:MULTISPECIES: hypothetical protein [unclassified Lelliottia]MDI3359781.1 hypothetical protein [Lelliottia sp. V89_13]MDK9548739.1 hypothetical protein [Lelliottia sp. V89_5]MDK9597371.1 hypothetical protein [Lelliottia sp. V89_10]